MSHTPPNPDATIPTAASAPNVVAPPPLVVRDPKPRRDFAPPPELDGPGRVQMIVAAVLGLVLVVIPIFLLGRPRTIGDPVSPSPASSASGDSSDESVAPHIEDAEPTLVLSSLSALKVASCHDAGPKKTPPDHCDLPEGLEAIIKSAIVDSASCVPPGAGGGAIAYGVDVSFDRKKSSIGVAAPKDGRTLKNPRVALKCASTIHDKLESQSLDAIKHEHARYRLSIVATYPGAVQP